MIRGKAVVKKKKRVSCLCIGVGISIVALILAVHLGFLKIKLDRSSCDDVLQGFAESMRRNRVETAQSLTSPDQWDRINSWVAGRKGIDCSFSLEPDHNQWWWGLVPCLDRKDALCSDFGFMCSYNDGVDGVYRFSITNAMLQKSKEGCLVVDGTGYVRVGEETAKIGANEPMLSFSNGNLTCLDPITVGRRRTNWQIHQAECNGRIAAGSYLSHCTAKNVI